MSHIGPGLRPFKPRWPARAMTEWQGGGADRLAFPPLCFLALGRAGIGYMTSLRAIGGTRYEFGRPHKRAIPGSCRHLAQCSDRPLLRRSGGDCARADDAVAARCGNIADMGSDLLDGGMLRVGE